MMESGVEGGRGVGYDCRHNWGGGSWITEQQDIDPAQYRTLYWVYC